MVIDRQKEKMAVTGVSFPLLFFPLSGSALKRR